MLEAVIVFLGIVVVWLLDKLSPQIKGFLTSWTQPEKEHAKLEAVNAELAAIQKELSTVSIMDEFAKHSRLQRQQIKKQAEQKRILQARTVGSAKVVAQFMLVKRVVAGIVNGALFFYFRTTPMYRYPASVWYPLAWLLAFPGHEPGVVGVVFWMFCCRSTLSSLFG